MTDNRNAHQRAQERAQEWTNRLYARLDPEQLAAIERQINETIDRVSLERWEAARERAAKTPGTLRPDRIRHVSASFARQLGTAGAAVGAMSAAPAVGMGVGFAAALAEMGWFTTRAGDLILTIAAIHGRPDPTVDERRAWVLAVLIYGSAARNGMSSALSEAGVGRSVRANGGVPVATLQAANRLMARALIRRYGTRRGLVALGTALPVGVGAAIGGSANYLAMRNLARDADRFFSKLPYSAIDVDSIDVTGRLLEPGDS